MRTGRTRKRFFARQSRVDVGAAGEVKRCTTRIVPLGQQSLGAQRQQISAAPPTKIRLYAASSRWDAWHVRMNRAVKLRINPGGIARCSIVPAIFCATRLVPFQRFFFSSSHAGDVNRFWWFVHAFTPADIASPMAVGSGHSVNFGTNPTAIEPSSTAPSTAMAITSGAAT